MIPLMVLEYIVARREKSNPAFCFMGLLKTDHSAFEVFFSIEGMLTWIGKTESLK
jgi:hypothetical protein